jgi:hypothetical protein
MKQDHKDTFAQIKWDSDMPQKSEVITGEKIGHPNDGEYFPTHWMRNARGG